MLFVLMNWLRSEKEMTLRPQTRSDRLLCMRSVYLNPCQKAFTQSRTIQLLKYASHRVRLFLTVFVCACVCVQAATSIRDSLRLWSPICRSARPFYTMSFCTDSIRSRICAIAISSITLPTSLIIAYFS